MKLSDLFPVSTVYDMEFMFRVTKLLQLTLIFNYNYHPI